MCAGDSVRFGVRRNSRDSRLVAADRFLLRFVRFGSTLPLPTMGGTVRVACEPSWKRFRCAGQLSHNAPCVAETLILLRRTSACLKLQLRRSSERDLRRVFGRFAA